MKIGLRLSTMTVLTFFLCLACLQPDKDEAGPGTGNTDYVFQWDKIADSSSTSLNMNFWNGAKYYNNSTSGDQFNYWPQAHALDVLIDAYARTQNPTYVTYMNDWFEGVKVKNGNTFINHFYDDMEWIALAMHRAYGVTGDEKWRDASVMLYGDIINGWNASMGGGIAWNKAQTDYKNTPANAPAAILAARLYRTTNDADYLTWAKKIYDWQKETLVNSSTGLVYDGINQDGNGQVQTEPGWNFAYNQGTFIGAALELYAITHEAKYLQDAVRTADNFIIDNIMSPGGIMRPGDNGDGGLFNGIGVRYLTQLILNADLSATKRENYVAYLQRNAETAWLKGTDRTRVIFNNNWNNQPGGTGFLTPQLSGCMLMEAMALLEDRDFLE